MDASILIAEDDADIRDLLRLYLEGEGFQVLEAGDGATALRIAREQSPSMAILDIMMPEMNGFELTRALRKYSNIPILILSAKSQDNDKILGLNLGADDYIAKPFRPRELVSRIRSVLRRCGKSQAVVTLGNVTVDTEKGVATKGGNDLYLSALEYRLLLVFVNNRGKVLSRSKLLEEIWDVAGDFVNDNTLTVYIKRLREKIEDDPQSPQIIRTVRGMGYKVDG